MPSRTHICNLSLLEIGQSPITDIADIITRLIYGHKLTMSVSPQKNDGNTKCTNL